MKILIIIDQYGWSYDSLARGLQKYSQNDITIRKLDDVTLEDMETTKAIFVFSWMNIITLQEKPSFRLIMQKKKIIAGSWSAIVPTEESYKQYTGRNKAPDLSVVDTMIVSDRRVWKTLTLNNANQRMNVFFADQAVDTEVFSPDRLKLNSTFKIGWCGNPTRPDKRVHLLDKLKYPVEKRALWGAEYFVKDRSLIELNDWYNSLDVYVSLSNAAVEGGTSLTVMEAMACGLPVIATAHGSEITNLLSDLMVVPIAESDAIQKTNELLDVLRQDPELRKSIGDHNRKVVEERYAWKVVAKWYDEIFKQSMLGLRYVDFNTLTENQKAVFLKRIRDDFVNDPDDDTLYLWGGYRIAGDTITFTLEAKYGYAVINRGGDMVGYWCFRWLPTKFGYGDKTACPSTVIDKRYRGMGIGKQLYEFSEHLAIQMGATKYWAANRHTTEEVPLNKTPYIYLKRGFKIVDSYEIISEPLALRLKPNPKWDKRKCIQTVFLKELKDE